MTCRVDGRSIFILLVVVGFTLVACSPPGIDSDRPAMVRSIEDSTPEVIDAPISAEDQLSGVKPTREATTASLPRATESAPVASELTQSQPQRLLEQGEWMTLPVIPEISERALAIYEEGLKKGNDPHAFSKVGDCQNVPSMFVSIFDHPGFYTLGEQNTYLLETIDWYQGSFERESQAVRRGFNAASVVSPVWANPEFCETGEDPLQCELRLHNPSIAIVSLETWWAGNPDNYEKYVRQILQGLVDEGVLPVLATKADNLEGDHRINEILAGLVHEFQIPLWNFWLAVQPLPNHGLMEDDFHLTFAPNQFDDLQMMEAAWPWRNLTALQVLDKIRETVQSTD